MRGVGAGCPAVHRAECSGNTGFFQRGFETFRYHLKVVEDYFLRISGHARPTSQWYIRALYSRSGVKLVLNSAILC